MRSVPSTSPYRAYFMKINWQVAGTVSLLSCTVNCGYFDFDELSPSFKATISLYSIKKLSSVECRVLLGSKKSCEYQNDFDPKSLD